jgi:hypothetical protein
LFFLRKRTASFRSALHPSLLKSWCFFKIMLHVVKSVYVIWFFFDVIWFFFDFFIWWKINRPLRKVKIWFNLNQICWALISIEYLSYKLYQRYHKS